MVREFYFQRRKSVVISQVSNVIACERLQVLQLVHSLSTAAVNLLNVCPYYIKRCLNGIGNSIENAVGAVMW